jgi:hypothetical protein
MGVRSPSSEKAIVSHFLDHVLRQGLTPCGRDGDTEDHTKNCCLRGHTCCLDYSHLQVMIDSAFL